MRKQPDDHLLVVRFQGGETSVFEEIVLKHQDRIYNLCRHMLGNVQDAEDAAQDTFVKAFKGLPGFRPEASLYTWLYRIAVNTCIDYQRRPFWASLFRGSGADEEFPLDPPDAALSPERLCEAKQHCLLLQKGLAGLSPKLRAVILLKEVEGLSYEGIAVLLEISVGTVKSRISRSREALKGFMNAIEQKRG